MNDTRRNGRKLFWVVAALCALLPFSGLFYEEHVHYRWEGWLGSYGIFGFVSCLLLALGARGLRVILKRDEEHNLEDICQSVSRDGYIVAQEYLPAAAAGDTRLFVMNGIPLKHKGKYAAFRRVRTGDDLRSNIHAGGKLRRAEVTDTMLELADMVRPRLVEDGMFLVGLDVVGDKLMEINVFSPGGLGSAQKFEKVNFTHAVLEALECKVQYMSFYRRNFSNVELATL